MSLDAHGRELRDVRKEDVQQLRRVDVLAVEGHADMQEVAAGGDVLSCLYLRAIRGEGLADMAVLHGELAVARRDEVLVGVILAEGDDRTAGTRIQGEVVTDIVYPVMEELLTRLGVYLLTVAEHRLDGSAFLYDKRHHESAGGLKLHLHILFLIHSCNLL